jgi:hypothetical protein
MEKQKMRHALKISSRTVKYDWAVARTWLFHEFSAGPGG